MALRHYFETKLYNDDLMIPSQADDFLTDLGNFTRRKWDTVLRIPHINGNPVDLFTMYHKVQSYGGWLKVSAGNRWPDILEAMHLPSSCAVAEHAVKVIYMRYLAKYEQERQFGEDSAEEEDTANSAHRARSKHYLYSLLSGNKTHDRVSDVLKSAGFGGRQRAPKNPYERILRSLESGLPNEVDFALNVCVVLSSPGPHVLLFARCPQLLSALVAHAGIFGEDITSYRPLRDTIGSPTCRLQMTRFWRQSVHADVAEMLLDALTASDTGANLARVDEDLLNLAQEFNRGNVVAQRISQICCVLRNLSFEDDNKAVMANSRSLMKFILACIHSKWSLLQSQALDILSNIASEMILKPVESDLTQLLFRTLNDCLYSDDKFHLIRGLEIIGDLCSVEQNEDILCEYLDLAVLQRIISMLTVKDIMLCVYLLECLYQISEMGPVTVQRIIEVPWALDTIVALITVEAVSFGPSGLMGMKVVEYGLPAASPASVTHVPPVSATAVPSSVPPTAVYAAPPTPLPASNLLQAPPTPVVSARAAAPRVSHDRYTATPNVLNETTVAPAITNFDSAPVAQHRGPAVTVHQDQQAEHAAIEWLKANCQVDPLASVVRSELYAKYVSMVQHESQNLAVSSNTFTNLIRQVFPSCICQTFDVGMRSSMKIEGVRYLTPRSTLSNATVSNTVLASTTYQQPAPNLNLSLGEQHTTVQRLLSPGTVRSSAPSALRSPNSILHNRLVQKISLTTEDAPRSVDSSTSETAVSSAPDTPDSGSSHCANHSPGADAERVASRSAVGRPALPLNCQLEVCQQAEEAGHLLNDHVKHEARIIRVENTLAPDDDDVEAFMTDGYPSHPRENCVASSDDDAAASLLPPQTLVIGNHQSRSPDPVHHGNSETDRTEAKVNGQWSPPLNSDHKDFSTDGGVAREKFEMLLKAQMSAKVAQKTLYNGLMQSDGFVAGKTALEEKKSPTLDFDGKYLNHKTIEQHLVWTPSPEDGEDSSDASCSNLSAPSQSNGTRTPRDEDSLSYAQDATIAAVVATANTAMSAKPDTAIGRNHTGAGGKSLTAPSPDMDSMQKNVDQCQANIQKLLCSAQQQVQAKLATESDASSTCPSEPAVSSNADSSPTSPTVNDATKQPKAQRSPRPGTQHQNTTRRAPSRRSGGSKRKSDSGRRKRPLQPEQGQTEPASKRMALTPDTNGQMVATTSGTPAGPFRIAPPRPEQLKFMCEWPGCEKLFWKANEVYNHVVRVHVPNTPTPCMWPHCDRTVRLHWSLITHLHDVHCNEKVLRYSAVRRYEISQCGHSNYPPPKTPPPHPGYARDASVSAIRRHALNFLTKDLTEENEGPVTKSLRLTSCLILRNLARYCSNARRLLRKYEGHLAVLALSRLESSTALAQCLAELHTAHSQLTGLC